MKVQELLDCEDKWTQGYYARNKDGEPIDYNSPKAVKWCLLGAIHKCYPLADEIIDEILDIIKRDIPYFNDWSSYEEIMELVRRLDI